MSKKKWRGGKQGSNASERVMDAPGTNARASAFPVSREKSSEPDLVVRRLDADTQNLPPFSRASPAVPRHRPTQQELLEELRRRSIAARAATENREQETELPLEPSGTATPVTIPEGAVSLSDPWLKTECYDGERARELLVRLRGCIQRHNEVLRHMSHKRPAERAAFTEWFQREIAHDYQRLLELRVRRPSEGMSSPEFAEAIRILNGRVLDEELFGDGLM